MLLASSAGKALHLATTDKELRPLGRPARGLRVDPQPILTFFMCAEDCIAEHFKIVANVYVCHDGLAASPGDSTGALSVPACLMRLDQPGSTAMHAAITLLLFAIVIHLYISSAASISFLPQSLLGMSCIARLAWPDLCGHLKHGQEQVSPTICLVS